MSVVAAMQPRLDQDRTMPQRVASDGEAPTTGDVGWLDAAAANWRLALDDDQAGNFGNKVKAYDDLEASLVAMGRPRARYHDPKWTSYWGVDTDKRFGTLWQDVEDARRANPRAFADIPKSQAEFDTWAYGRKGEHARDRAVAAQGGFGSQIAPSLAFGISTAGTAENLPQLLLGGGTKTAAQFVWAQFYAGMLGTALQTPATVRSRANMGEDYSSGELATDMLIGGAANTAFAGAIAYGPRAGAKIYDKVVPFDYRAAQALKQATPAHLMPPDVAAAWNVLTRHEEVADASPYTRTYSGDDAHFTRLREVTDSMVAGDKLPIAPVPVARAVAGAPGAGASRASSGLASVDAYMAAARRQESGGNDGAASGTSSASGRFGFIDGTWVAYYRKTFPNTGLSDAAIIARKSNGQAQDRVMRTFTEENAAWLQRVGQEATPGNLYVVHHLGTGGADKIFGAAADVPLASILPSDVMKKNPHLRGMTAGEFRSWADRKMGGDGSVVASTGGDVSAPIVRPPELDGARPVVDMPDLVPSDIAAELADVPTIRPEVMNDGLLTAMRTVIDDRKLSLNDIPALARELGTDAESLAPIMQRLVDDGRLTLTKSGIYRRRMAQGPEDALTFIARRGGLAYDGLSVLGREKGTSRGHDLKNSGNLDAFVPQSGPLLRPTGRGLDEVGQSLWDAGYFGPPETTPRPTDGELITWLDDAIGRKEKRYSFFDNAPEAKAKASDYAAPEIDPAAALMERDARWAREEGWQRAAEMAGAQPFFPAELAKLEKLLAEGTDTLPPHTGPDLPPTEELAPYVVEMVNREIDDALEAAYLEIEDPAYDLYSDAYGDQAGGAETSGGGSAPDAGSARAGETGGRAGPEPAELDAIDAAGLGPDRFDEAAHTAFDDPAGDGVAQVADSAWHDVRAAVEPKQLLLEQRRQIVDQELKRSQGEWLSRQRNYVENKMDTVAESDGMARLGEENAANDDPSADLALENADAAFVRQRIQMENQFGKEFAKNNPYRAELSPDAMIQLRQIDQQIAELSAAPDKGAAIDPNIAALDRQRAQLGADAPMRAKAEQDGTMGSPLFDAVDQPTFDLGDGRGARTIDDIDAEIAADMAAIDAIKGCLL